MPRKASASDRRAGAGGAPGRARGEPGGEPGSSGAGGPALNANLPFVTSLAVDTTGNLFVAFTGDFPIGGIWKVDTAGGISAFVGGGTDTTSVGIPRQDVETAPLAVAFDPSGRLLFL